MIRTKSPLLQFAENLSGKYSNVEQAQKNPRDFAHINIYFLPIEWSILQGAWFYSEQSYDYAPWSPYRQGIHQILSIDNIFIVENYSLNSPEKFAGSGFMPDLLKDIRENSFRKRDGCAMHFTQVSSDIYLGKVEPGQRCLIQKGDRMSYLVSNIELRKDKWLSLDEGFDLNTNKKIWGAEHGYLKFKKIQNFKNLFVDQWLEL
ncbi:chromophore lyase CpcT/CpeT [Prochlorococcus sp. MIT 1307]|uniref:chromophore lyase CpcT/CpeT n=1 Tax=Prochlorococcus sp. MIT 1307 TaxID=3096219 RepID=UPI002A752642|nr:chromophore lyase CpcT/CpeT [Prochlorococcus sp. MIT 1307]